MEYQLTKIISTKPQTLTKSYWLDDAGKMQRSTVANMSEGHADTITLDTPAQFAGLLTGLKHNEALCYGLPPAANMRVLSKKKFDEEGRPSDATPRSKEAFKWPSAGGILMLDYDPEKSGTPLSKAQLLDALAGVLPELKTSAYVWWCSASSLIYNDQEQLHGVRGQRVYILVQNAQDIPRAGAVLFKRLWLAGHGFYMISRAGTALERTIIDGSVWQTNRLDFAAGAQCTAPLEQRRGAPVIHDGDVLDTRAALPDLTEAELADYEAKKAAAKEAIKPEQKAVRFEYRETEAVKLLEKQGKELTEQNLEAARQTIDRALNGGVLAGDFLITLADRTQVTIGELLDSPSKYHQRRTLDPLEPEYNGFKVVGMLYLMGGTPNLYSQAHGGKNYRLIRQPREIQQIKGRTTDTTHRTLEYLRQLPDVFDMGSVMVLVKDGKTHQQTPNGLAYWLGAVAQYWSVDQYGQKTLVDPPVKVINQMIEIKEMRQLKPLKAVITAPVMTKDMRVISRVGYDDKTQLYLDMPQAPLSVPDDVTDDQAKAALEFLMRPFKGFMTAGALDRAVLLAAVLTAVQRPVLPTAPAFGLDAPVQGTGKTYLAQCLGALATGEIPPVYPHTAGRDDEEVRKRLTTVLASGARVMVWDNILGAFDSVAMASLLTTEVFNDRILGKSEAVSIPSRILMLLTGNNLTLAGDMPRRVLKCRLDAQIANPAARKFDSNPLEYIVSNRQQLVQAALTLIKGYLQSHDCMMGGAVAGESTASFEDWDYMIRQTVAWVAGTLGVTGYADPAQALKDAVATDPEAEALGEILQGIDAVMGTGWFETKELHRRVVDGFSGWSERGELKDALEDMNGGKPLTVKGLGRILSYRVGRIVEGRRLAIVRTSSRARFRLEKVE